MSNRLKTTAKIATLCLIAVGLASANTALAASKKTRKSRRFPNGCREIGAKIENGFLVLTPTHKELDQKQSIFFLRNLSHHSVLLKVNKDKRQSRYSPSYQNTIRPNRWGSFAIDLPDITFACYTASRGMADQQIDCAHLFDICQYNNVKFSDANGGNYWVVKSSSLRGAIHTISRDVGILLRW